MIEYSDKWFRKEYEKLKQQREIIIKMIEPFRVQYRENLESDSYDENLDNNLEMIMKPMRDMLDNIENERTKLYKLEYEIENEARTLRSSAVSLNEHLKKKKSEEENLEYNTARKINDFLIDLGILERDLTNVRLVEYWRPKFNLLIGYFPTDGYANGRVNCWTDLGFKFIEKLIDVYIKESKEKVIELLNKIDDSDDIAALIVAEKVLVNELI